MTPQASLLLGREKKGAMTPERRSQHGVPSEGAVSGCTKFAFHRLAEHFSNFSRVLKWTIKDTEAQLEIKDLRAG